MNPGRTNLDTIERSSGSEAETLALAASLAPCLAAGDVLALDGELGAGKTCFTRGIVEALGGRGRDVSSPTFVLCHEYATARGLTIMHLDAYRLHAPEEIETIGFDEMTERDDAVTIIEWASKVAPALPRERTIHLLIEVAINADPRRGGETGSEQPTEQLPPTTHDGVPSGRLLRLTVPRTLAARFQPWRARTRPCPACGTSTPIDTPHFPFCSPRCRMADLNDWFTGKQAISRPLSEDDQNL